MKAKEVMEKLDITRPTLCSYVQKGWIKATKLPNGQYDYDDVSVASFGCEQDCPMLSQAVSDLKTDKLNELLSVINDFFVFTAKVNMLPPDFAQEFAKLFAEYKALK